MSPPAVRLPLEEVAALPGPGRPAVDASGGAVLAGDGEVEYLGSDGWHRLAVGVAAADLPGPVELVERLPGDRWLLAATMSPRGPDGGGIPNAVVISAAGAVEERFSIGDGVDDLQAGPEGDLWVSYQFLGTMGDYGRNGWGRLSPVLWIEPIGGSGLARFDRHGGKAYDFSPPPGASPVMDAFALNVGDEHTWVCYHPGFALIRVDRRNGVQAWRSPVWGVDALAVAGDRVFLHRLGRPAAAWVLGRLGSEGELVALEPAALEPFTEDVEIQRVVGRGSCLHVFTATAWYRLDLAVSC